MRKASLFSKRHCENWIFIIGRKSKYAPATYPIQETTRNNWAVVLSGTNETIKLQEVKTGGRTIHTGLGKTFLR